jgi:phosphinothricin acetyltransferase
MKRIMPPEDPKRFGPARAALKGGRQAILRPLTADDGEALGEFYESVPREDTRFHCPYPLTRERAMRNARQADEPGRVTLVAQEPNTGRILGYAWYGWPDESSAKSGLGICIRRGHQDAGVGRALLTRLLEIARVVGPPVMQLTVQLANAKAIALYRKMGFVVVAEQMRQPTEAFAAEPEFRMERRCRECAERAGPPRWSSILASKDSGWPGSIRDYRPRVRWPVLSARHKAPIRRERPTLGPSWRPGGSCVGLADIGRSEDTHEEMPTIRGDGPARVQPLLTCRPAHVHPCSRAALFTCCGDMEARCDTSTQTRPKQAGMLWRSAGVEAVPPSCQWHGRRGTAVWRWKRVSRLGVDRRGGRAGRSGSLAGPAEAAGEEAA